jgi:hypothetical protein
MKNYSVIESKDVKCFFCRLVLRNEENKEKETNQKRVKDIIKNSDLKQTELFTEVI